MTDSPLINTLMQVIRDYDISCQKRLDEAQATITRLGNENAQLRQEVERGSSLLDEITDEYLKKRLASLGSSPLDTWVREAGVVLEDRLRKAANIADNSLTGVALVDSALAPQKGALVYSSHPGEQDGVRLLYRGAIQFIRNPPMHNLIEYQASMAQTLLRLTDSLLKLLAEVPSGRQEDVKLTDIRRMLTRIPIPEGQRLLYHSLYKANDKGLTGAELSTEIGRTRFQVAGILGALGNRVNGTEGLENKGAVAIILEITRLNNGDYLCRMKPILRQALELERLA